MKAARAFAVVLLACAGAAWSQTPRYFQLPPRSAPHDVAPAPDGNERDKVWLTEWSTNAILRFDPEKETFERYPSDRPNAQVRQMLGRAGEAWGAESGTDRLVMIPSR